MKVRFPPGAHKPYFLNTFMLLFFLILSLLIHPPVYAKYDPLTVPNNKFGIHIVDPNDVTEVSDLINSSGGDWGYVTLVIQEGDRNTQKWQVVFNTMRQDHLIPIVRLATQIDGNAWKKPTEESIRDWISFLNSLNWPIENRYIVLFNEPNHANEWGRSIDPEGYANLATAYAKAFHNSSDDFFVLPAGLDDSAASDGNSLDAATYLRRMYTANPHLFDLFDGWTSHSYPNPAFSGSAYATGKGTVQSYAWERQYLQSLGVSKAYPIFITETGWVHSFGVTTNYGLLSPDQVGSALQQAANSAWADKNIVAVTPFIYNYQGLPFDHFSWKKLGSTEFYPHYYAYQAIPKTRGIPFQHESYVVKHSIMPETLVMNSTITLVATITNTGQSIISEKSGYSLTLEGPAGVVLTTDAIPTIAPNETGDIVIHLQLPNLTGIFPYTLSLVHDGRNIVLQTGTLTLIPPPSVTLHVQLGWRRVSDTSLATVLIYDHDTLIHKIQGVTIKNGRGVINDLINVIPNTMYRVVVLVPYYLPRQSIVTIKAQNTTIAMPRMFPFDWNNDGGFTFADVWTMLTLPPRDILRLFITI